MTEISAISRTQKIIVNPISGVVKIVDTLTYIRVKGA